jgi:Ca2+-binding EF-hand superfamily protein
MTRTNLLAMLLTGCLAAPALAEGDRLLAGLDANGDGAISRPEFLVLRQQMFARIDADGSGTVTEAEVAAAEAAMAKRRQRQVRDLWSQDADGDGELTLAEYTSSTPGFDRADRDGDGVLSGAEIDRVARLIGSFGDDLATPPSQP